jgi:menaquinone-specific isochorismate synthase
MDVQVFLKEELAKIDSFLNLTDSFHESQQETHFPAFSLTDLMSFTICENVFYFESKEEDFAFLGLGKSRELKESAAKDFLEKSPNHLIYQGVFEKSQTPLIYLPEWAFVKKGNKITLTINANIDSKKFTQSKDFFNLETWESFVSPWTSYEEHPEHDEWSSMMAEALKLLNKNELQKIVLSRKKVFSYDEPIETLVMFRELYLYNQNSSHFTIYYQPSYNDAFISFSPERLFTLKGHDLETISLAGSILRGQNAEEDAEFELILKNSKKLIHEHETVTKEIEEKLTPVTENLTISPLHTMKLPYIQHRQATIKGKLKKGFSSLELINLMHPTSAVGGIPHSVAALNILKIEKEKRNLYAAPFGILSKEYSEVAVAIRSGHIKDNMVTVYGGAGIVNDSEAEEEWIETGTKMQPFTKVLNKSVI